MNADRDVSLFQSEYLSPLEVMSKNHCVALVPCYNGSKFLHDSVSSLVNQTHPLNRIFIIDDGSSDDSKSIIEALAREHPAIEGVYHKRNRGKAACLNECFDHIETDYFFLQDSDDIAHPNRVERQLAFMMEHIAVACSSSFVRYINESGRQIGNGKLDLVSKERLQTYLMSMDPFGLFCPAVVLSGAMIKTSGLRFRQEFWPADDIDLWNRIAEAGHKVLAQPEFLVDYRVHSNSAVTSGFFKTRERFEYVRDSLRARRSGQPEPDWETFQDTRSKRPPLVKLNDWRKTLAKGLYRNAGFQFGERKPLRGAFSLLRAAVLQPRYVIPRLVKQVL